MPEVRVSVGAAWRQAIESLSELLDAILEGTMKRLFFTLIAALLFVQCAYAFEIPFTDIKIFEYEPIINEAAQLEDPPLEIIIGYPNESIVDTVTRIFRIGAGGEKSTTINLNNKVLATLPEGSRFEGVPIHKSCLEFQYGTEMWYNCEMAKVE